MYRSKSGVEGSFLKEKTFLKGRFVSLIYTFFAHGYDEFRMRRDLLLLQILTQDAGGYLGEAQWAKSVF